MLQLHTSPFTGRFAPPRWLVRAAALASCAGAVSAQCEVGKLVSPVPAIGDRLGQSVVLDGNTALVGAIINDAGFAFGKVSFYGWDGVDWIHEVEFHGTAYDERVGYSVALDGDTAVIGGAEVYGVCGDRGSNVSVFERTGGVWALTERLLPHPANAAPVIGNSVDICGDTIVVGAALEYCGGYGVTHFGEAFVYERTPSGWVADARLLPEPDYGLTNFGIDVAIDGDLVTVGSPSDLFSSVDPSVYVFERAAGGWVQRARLRDPGLGGGAVAISGRTLVAALSLGFDPSDTFVYVEDGAQWTLQQVLPDRASSVAIEGDTIVLGGVGGQNASRVKVYERAGGRWFDRRRFGARETDDADRFGLVSVDLDAGRLIVGATGSDAGPVVHAGAAYVFDRDVATSYCTTTVNTTGHAARLSAASCPSVFQDSLVLHAEPLPDNVGMFVFGDGALQVPFGAGTRCVGGAVFRTPAQRVEANRLEWEVDYDHPNPLGKIVAGSTWYFQAWFRDGPTAINTTDGLEITFLP